VIFHDYHFKNKVVSAAVTPEEEGLKRTSYTKKMTKSILRTNVLV
jgi:hypothetical protein